jgi:hypothetical protein
VEIGQAKIGQAKIGQAKIELARHCAMREQGNWA